jgi:hypothetical protein
MARDEAGSEWMCYRSAGGTGTLLLCDFLFRNAGAAAIKPRANTGNK